MHQPVSCIMRSAHISCTVRTASAARTTHLPVHTLPHALHARHAPHALYIRTVIAVLHCHVKFTHHMQHTHIIHCTHTRTGTHQLSASHHTSVRITAPTTCLHTPSSRTAHTRRKYALHVPITNIVRTHSSSRLPVIFFSLITPNNV